MFDTNGSFGVQDSRIIMPDSMFLHVGSPTDSTESGKIFDPKNFVLSLSVDSKCHLKVNVAFENFNSETFLNRAKVF